MSAGLMIYGATGYTGRLLADEALARGLRPILAGRDPGKLAKLRERTGCETRCFMLNDPAEVQGALDGVGCVLHAAGPFAVTARPMIEACIARRAHYLDITGELPVFQLAESLSGEAKAHGVMLLPGVGWDVVPSDCLAAHTAARVGQPRTLRIALRAGGGVSRGSVKTGAMIIALGARARRGGVVVEPDDLEPRRFEFGDGAQTCVPIPMGDIITAWKSTGAPNIEVYLAVDEGNPLELDVDSMPEGPSPEERDAARAQVSVEVTGVDATIARAVIDTASGYAYTAESGIEVARRVLAGDFKPGFQSPATAYGVELATSVGLSKITDLP